MLYLILSSVIVAVLTFLSAQATYVINGQVRDNSGKPACGVRVCALAEDFDPNKLGVVLPCALSDLQGKFTITVNKASKYKLTYADTANGYVPGEALFIFAECSYGNCGW